ncbi:TonB-dependent receptor plug domain-containing protein [Roseateles sp. DB2]|uniref:TonB-dependent receptor plug domain-containing protein n=1 Tax=Roseateles sp. DB2 TaxID=3453717 RepID=UPI003EE8D436
MAHELSISCKAAAAAAVLPRCAGLLGVLYLALGLGTALQVGAAEPPQAQEPPSLEELLKQGLTVLPKSVQVSTASRFAQTAETSALTYVLTEQDIRGLGLRSLRDVLDALPGLYITSNSNFSFVGARGLGRPGDFNSRVLLMIDGVRVNENTTDAALIGPEFYLDVQWIERVEFTPGPGSAVYGNNAFLGVINVIPKRADKLQGWRAGLMVDSTQRRELQLSWAIRGSEGQEAMLGLALAEQARVPLAFEVPPALFDAIQSLHTERVQRAFGTYSHRGLSIRGGHSERTLGSAVWLDGRDQGRGLVKREAYYRNSMLALSQEFSLGPSTDLTLDISGKRTRVEGRRPYLDEDGQRQVWRTVNDGRWVNAGVRLGFSQWPGHRLMLGWDTQQDYVQQIYLGPWGQVPYLHFLASGRGNGLFVQDDWDLGQGHHLSLGLRRDRDDRVDGVQLNPRLAWTWQIDADRRLRLVHGSAYRVANLMEFAQNYFVEAPQWLPSEERVRSQELVYEHSFSRQTQLRLSLFRSSFRGLIGLSEALAYENEGQMKSLGLDLGLEQRWSDGSRLQASVTAQHLRDAQGRVPDNSPGYLLKLQYQRPLNARWTLGWQTQAMGARHVASVRLAPVMVNHLHLTARWPEGWTLGLGVRNLGQKDYGDIPEPGSGLARAPGRTVFVQLTSAWGS